MRYKDGVILHGMDGVMLPVQRVVEEEYDREDLIAVFTSGKDGVHGANSLHNWNNTSLGRAADYRTRQIYPPLVHIIAQRIRARLGKDYDVVVHELPETPHIHIEYDPKRTP